MSPSLFALVIFSINLLAVALAITLGHLAGNPAQKFGEHHFTTWLSGLQLLIVAWFSFQTWQKRADSRVPPGINLSSPTTLWLIIAVGFFYLTADELLRIHEQLDKLIHAIFGLTETSATDRIDDYIVGGYGLIGIFVIYSYRAEMIAYRSLASFLGIAFALMFLMVGLDSLTNREDVLLGFLAPPYGHELFLWLEAAEDSVKLFAEGAFVAVFYAIKFESAKAPGPSVYTD